jgi:hypothetical protein
VDNFARCLSPCSREKILLCTEKREQSPLSKYRELGIYCAVLNEQIRKMFIVSEDKVSDLTVAQYLLKLLLWGEIPL